MGDYLKNESHLINDGERKYGIDLLRIVSMLMVCNLHILGHGGVLENVVFGTSQYNVAQFFAIISYSAVNCFALISGFVGYTKAFKFSNIILLWLQVSLLNGVISGIFAFLNGNMGPEVLLEFLPILQKRFWYFSVYFGLYFLMPILNTAINNTNRKLLELSLIILFFLFSFGGFFFNLFQLEDGYSLIWLTYLYLVGGYISKHKPFAKVRTYLIVIFATLLILGVWVLKVWKNRDLFGYLSPAHVLFAVALLEIFSRIEIKGKIWGSIILFFAKTSFGVFIIHSQKDFWRLLSFYHYAEFNTVLLSLAIIGTSLIIYISCTIIDYIRLLIFRVLRVKDYLQKLDFKNKLNVI